MKTLIVGYGEIGKALYSVLNNAGYDVKYRDFESSEKIENIDVMHVYFLIFSN